MIGPKPFLKWAGGKGQLLSTIGELIPVGIRTYFEPFLGGGAVFWMLGMKRDFEQAVLNDFNQELIDTYTAVRDSPDKLIAALNTHRSMAWNTKEYFEGIRRQNPKDLALVDRAARMIYLNKTCYNGLYRVNKKGEFNTPFGKYRNPGLFESGSLRACASVLNRSVQLRQGDFTEAVATAGPGDLVYFDPPYVPVSDTANFLSYTSDGFSGADQHRLALTAQHLADRDVSVILSNSDTELVRKLYEGFEMINIRVKRNINSKASGRGHVGELLIVHRGEVHRRAPKKFDYLSLGD